MRSPGVQSPDALVAVPSELMRALPDATVLHVEEYDLATMADIAKRSGRTPESIRLLVGGKRGPREIPADSGTLSLPQALPFVALACRKAVPRELEVFPAR